VPFLVPHRLDLDGLGDELKAVVFLHGRIAERPEGRGQRLDVPFAEAEKVEVARGAIRFTGPEDEEQGAFQDEAVPMTRRPEAIEKPFQGVADEDEIDVLAALAGAVGEALANGRREVARLV